MDDVSRFLNELLEEVFDAAHAEAGGLLRQNALVATLLERLGEAGMCHEPQPAHFRLERGSISAEVHGYAFDSEDDTLTLFYVIDSTAETTLGDPAEVVNTPKGEVDRGFRRLAAFVKLAERDNGDQIEESLPAWELGQMIREAKSDGLQIEYQVLATGRVSDRTFEAVADDEVAREVRDITLLSRVCGTNRNGTTDIDFVGQYGGPLSCLVTPQAEDGLQVLLTCISGQTLAAIYNTYRAALLERNVRSFLQFTGKVNKGIRDTLLNEPGRFLPYNNGLSATARAVDIEVGEGGIGRIRSVSDFQVVNGGQTTASIASAVRRDMADLSRVMVPMKLTVVPEERLNDLVPKISRYANTQNRVQDSDFSANEPWHVGIEQLSRSVWTRPTDDAPRGTRWFYERSRGQYKDALAECGTTAGRKKFRQENPNGQKFTKTDIAKYLSSWDQVPHIVSRGAQKCFQDFMTRLGADARRKPSGDDYRRFMALAMLFRHAEKLHNELGYTGYRANVVTYSVAALSHHVSRQLDTEVMWKTQQIPGPVDVAMRIIMTGVRQIITTPPSRYKNVTEWSKRLECWSAVSDQPFDLDLKKSVVTNAEKSAGGSQRVTSDGEATNEETGMVTAAAAVPGTVWFAVSKWAKDTDRLKSWQRSLAFSLGKVYSNERQLSVKQARQGRKLILEATRLGFASEELSDVMLQRIDCNDA